jgi:hypothetical protein
MAIFHKNTLAQVSGFDNPILAGELVWNQRTYWNLVFTTTDPTTCAPTPLDLTGATIDAQIIRRELTNVQDTRNGLTFDIGNYTPTPTSIPLTVTNVDEANGVCTLVIDSDAWDLINSDPELKIDATNPVGFSGRIIVSFPASGTTPIDDSVIFLLFIVRSDGIIVV